MDVFLLALLTTLNALFAMSEMALSTSRRARLAALAETGDAGAAAALKLMQDPTQFLSSVQIGITSIGMLSGIAIWMLSPAATRALRPSKPIRKRTRRPTANHSPTCVRAWKPRYARKPKARKIAS